jgi:tight adherence protein C
MELVIAATSGLAVFLLLAALLGARSADTVKTRLELIATLDAPTLEELELRQPLVDRTLRPFFGRLTEVARRISSPKTVSRTDERLAQAGFPGGLRTVEFLAIKLLIAGVAGGLAFFFVGVLGRNLLFGSLIGLTLVGIGYLGPEFWLRSRIRRRQTEILLAIPDTLDLLTISVRAGLGFDSALAKVVEKMRGPLPDEFRRALAEIRVGKPRRDALRDLAARADVPSLSSFVGAIIQAEQLGVPIARVLQVQSEQLRIERRQRAEELAAKAPVKLLLPLVGCIFPAMFVVILGPAIILIMQNLGRAV